MTNIIHSTNDSELIDLWLSDKAENTLIYYEQAIDGFQQFTAYKPLQQCTVADVQLYLMSLDGARKITHRSALSSLFNKGFKLGYLQYNIGAALPKNPQTTSTILSKYISRDMIWDIIAHGKHTKINYSHMFHVLYTCGLRINELLTLTWDRVKFREDDALLDIIGKGGYSRTIKAINGTHLILREEYEVKDGNLVFPVTKQSVTKHLKEAARLAGFDKWQKISPHWLRHNCATHLVENDAPLKYIQEHLGHADLNTTSRYLWAKPGGSASEYLERG